MRKLTFFTGIAVILLLSACDNFFSNPLFGLGEALRQTFDPPAITAENLDAYLAKAKSPEAKKAVLQGIINALDPDNPDYEMIEKALKLGTSTSKVDEALLGNGIDLIIGLIEDDFNNIDADLIMGVFNSVISDLDKEAINLIAEVSAYAINAGSPPKFNANFNPSADDVGIAVLALTLGIADGIDIEKVIGGGEFDLDELPGIGFSGGNFTSTGPGADQNTAALAAYLNLLKDDSAKPQAQQQYQGNLITGLLQELFANL